MVLHETLQPTGADAVIAIHGAREHNLKNLSVEIPRGKFVVVTGVSGSGKSTLAFDLLFAEGQRRFLDAMNTYARQFVEQMARPDVDLISGIPPTVSIEQRNSRGGGKSTVATVTEVYHFVRLLFARLGTQYCPDCDVAVEPQTRDQVTLRLQDEARRRGSLTLLAPLIRGRKGFHTELAEWAQEHGYAQIRADGTFYSTDEAFRLDRFREHNVEVVTGLLDRNPRRGARPARTQGGQGKGMDAPGTGARSPQQLVDETLAVGKGILFALDDHGELTVHSTERACPSCGRSFAPLDPKFFSYNSAAGWCPRCRGFGELFYLPEDVDRGARADAIEESWWGWQEGKREPCPECRGARLNPVARAVRLTFAGIPRAGRGRGENAKPAKLGPTIDEVGALSVEEAGALFGAMNPRGRDAEIARDILPEIRERLRFLREVGLDYLQLQRSVTTLSGGENQRIRLAAQLGSNLSGVLYVLDEPTIGLHARDNERLLEALTRLKDRGNSLVVVEHDEETMRRADWILDLGPGAGIHGGQVVAAGTLDELSRHEDSVTGRCLRDHPGVPSRGSRRPVEAPPATGTTSLEPPQERGLQSAGSHAGQGTSLRAEARAPHGFMAIAHGLGAKGTLQEPPPGRAGTPWPAGSGAPGTTRPTSTARLMVTAPGRQAKGTTLERPGASAAQPVPWLTLHHASANNLKDLTVRFPLGRLVLVTGVSGSGKSTLIRECLLPALQHALPASRRKNRPTTEGGRESTDESEDMAPDAVANRIQDGPASTAARSTAWVSGHEGLTAVHEVDQSPIGRTPRSTPATYVGFFDDIRALFAQVPESRLRGYGPGRFSFNSAQGRCPECEGAGLIKLEMNFLPPAFVRCETCNGLRFNPETLDITFNGRNIAEVLELSVAEAREFFAAFRRIRAPLDALHDTGLDYLKLGQTSPTLSGGEAQRVKLVTHLLTGLKEARAVGPTTRRTPEADSMQPALALNDARAPYGVSGSTGNAGTNSLRAQPRQRSSCFILEEPTIGLHMADVRRLVEVLHRLVDAGHTVLVIEHNLDLIAEADWIIDLGPEGGDAGGRIVAEGTPEAVARCRASHTGRHLAPLLERARGALS